MEKLSKDKFFEILQNANENPVPAEVKQKVIEPNAKAGKKRSATETSWSVFDENYMLHNQKLKDWDKKTEEDEQMEQEIEGEIEGYGW